MTGVSVFFMLGAFYITCATLLPINCSYHLFRFYFPDSGTTSSSLFFALYFWSIVLFNNNSLD